MTRSPQTTLAGDCSAPITTSFATPGALGFILKKGVEPRNKNGPLVFKRCLISVSDKSHLDVLTQGLAQVAPDCEYLSTGGTAKKLRELGCQVRDISEFTGFPEAFEGRLKTLHPKVHGGILYRRGQDDERAGELGIVPIDLVVVNLYPFRQAYVGGSSDLTEMIDIGGPTLLRAAAKNAESVVVVCDPGDYQEVIRRAAEGTLDATFRRRLRAKVFAHTAAYDAQIAAVLCEDPFPEQLTLSLKRCNELRYGENPHQKAAFYELDFCGAGFSQHHGKELSYNNLLDLSAALLPLQWDFTCCVVKHAAPCGLARGNSSLEAFELAWAGDPVSAFGSVVSFSSAVDAETARALKERFIEVIAAPAFSEEAFEILKAKKNLRLLTTDRKAPRTPLAYGFNALVNSGVALLQTPDLGEGLEFQQATQKTLAPEREPLAQFALTAVRCLKSNAIAVARQTSSGALQTMGLGGGQPNRVQALRIALANAEEHFGKESLASAVLASDAFFPFPDSIEAAAEAGIGEVVSPGGSMRDPEVIAAAERLGVRLTFVNRRLFRH